MRLSNLLPDRLSATAMSSTADVVARRRKSRIRWTVRAVVVAILLGLPLGCGLDRLFYHPNSTIYYTPAQLNLRHEEVRFTTRDGVRLHGWWLPALTARPLGTIVHFHGNAANISNHILAAYWLPPAGYHLLMFDYRGYGQSEGSPTREGTIADGHAALDYVLTRPEVDRERLYFYGQSLTQAVAVVVAAERPEVRKIVVEQTFGDYREIAAEHLARRVLWKGLAQAIARATVSDGYDPVDVVAKISPRPIFVIASQEDAICFPALGQRLFDAAAEPKQFWLAQGAEHLSIHDRLQAEHERRVKEFLNDQATSAPHE